MISLELNYTISIRDNGSQITFTRIRTFIKARYWMLVFFSHEISNSPGQISADRSKCSASKAESLFLRLNSHWTIYFPGSQLSNSAYFNRFIEKKWKEWEKKSLIKPILNLFWAACQIWGGPSDIFRWRKFRFGFWLGKINSVDITKRKVRACRFDVSSINTYKSLIHNFFKNFQENINQ